MIKTQTSEINAQTQQDIIKPKKEEINGIILLDKPTGISSNHALQTVKRLLNAKKAGHTGSLDPLASGMLPICLGEATKFSQYLLDSDKQYLVVAKLGIKTATGDAEGEIIAEKPVPEISAQTLQEVLQKFLGKTQQIPSMYSAIKYQGEPLYKLARKGLEVERQARDIHIYNLLVLDHKADTITLDVHCSKGTYIRTLVEDIGEALGCGAHVIYLRRSVVSQYDERQMVTLKDLETAKQDGMLKSLILPIETTVHTWPKVILNKSSSYYLQRGQAVLVAHAPSSGWVQLFDENDIFIGVGEIIDCGKVTPRRLVKAPQ